MKALNFIFRFQMTIDKLIMKALNFIFRFQMTIDKFKIVMLCYFWNKRGKFNGDPPFPLKKYPNEQLIQ